MKSLLLDSIDIFYHEMFTTSTTNFQSLSKSIGYSKDRTYAFNQYKNEIAMKKRRFQKREPTPSFLSSTSTASSSNDRSGKSGDLVIEMNSRSQLPPQWVDIYEETLEKLKQAKDIHKEIEKLSAKRIKSQFGDFKKMDQQINDKTHEATRLLRECEENVNRISQIGSGLDQNEADKKIRKNIQKSLATQVSEAIMSLRKNQKNLYQKIKALDNGSDVNLVDSNADTLDDDQMQEMEMMDDIARERDEAINQLIDTINELSHIFKQLNQLVIDQGTILDRIDYNIEQTVQHTRKAKTHLKKAAAYQDSGCAKKCIMILVGLNVLFAFMLFLKFKSHS